MPYTLSKFPRASLLLAACVLISTSVAAKDGGRSGVREETRETPRVRVAVLDFGETETGRRASRLVAELIAASEHVALVPAEQARAAARGVGYGGSLNMTLAEARDLAAAIDCDFFVTGDAQTLRRTSSARPVYFESYASVFVVSGRTGRLVAWERPSFDADAPEEAERLLLAELARRAGHYRVQALRSREDEQAAAGRELATPAPLVEDAPDDAESAAQNFRPPAPYRRLRPDYPETAARAEAEATVDVTVEVGADGSLGRVEVVRWAGFGLDDAVVSAVRRMHFRPASRDGEPVAVRVLLRYNFRRSVKDR